jgi:hypothetical protein
MTTERDPHPTFKDLLTHVSHGLHKMTVPFHQQARTYRKNVKLWQRHQNMTKRQSNSTDDVAANKKKRRQKKTKAVSEGFVLEMDNFQNPQLSSHRPLVRFSII